ncbi:MAG: asparagine synthase (glutamine-hydrolyzing) [Ginsengibacter sp.]
MCRIAGIVNKTLPLSAVETMVKEMCDLQKHGGPDDEGLYSCVENNLVLGHRRLALIDLSAAGHQPMIYQNRYVISFNGEIYNFPELKNELKQMGKQFQTHSDTEVILAAFAQWNTQSFAKLSGMFAFALYDTLEKNLYLVRDASGIKPLYYSVADGTIEFASEIRAFNALGDKKENKQWPVFQLAYGFIPEPVTTLQNVKPLHKGCFYKLNLSTGVDSLQSFAHYSYSDSMHDPAASRDVIRSSIQHAVKRHLLSDAPIGVFLSGGIDSSIVTSLAFDSEAEHLKTLSIYFNEAQFSEKKYQDSIIENLHCKYYQHLLTEAEFQESFPAILQAMDMPSCDGLNTWFISKYAKQHGLKAVLSGVGADELFGGYPSFGRISIAGQLQNMPAALLQSARYSGTKKIKRLTYLSLEGTKGLYLFLRGLFTPSEIAQQLGATEKETWAILEEQPMLPGLNALAPKNAASWIEMNIYMQDQLLRDADVMSMAHGVEIRVPFLDKDVIQTALSIDAGIKYKGPLPKQILINAFKDKLPENIWNRKKMGFSFPFTQWMSNNAFVEDTMQNGSTASQLSYKKFKEGKLFWNNLMSLLILENRGVN